METPALELVSLRPYLFKIAYSMTGVVEEAEDIVQDVYTKWLEAGRAEVSSTKAYLARMVVNRCINRANEMKKERESYKGFWMPEPYITLSSNDEIPSVDYGLLLLLERLNPLERAVFILRESFSESYEVIAELTGQTEDNCRQILHRARQKTNTKAKTTVDSEKVRALTEAFLAALHQQDRSALEVILRQDIELYGDGGGKKAASLKPLLGIDKVVKFLLGISKLEQDSTYTYKPGFINGKPAALFFEDKSGELDSSLTIECDEQGISRLLYVRNPDKLRVR
jgi:RNA polymerase sigma-70 factor (ECF subfamily)